LTNFQIVDLKPRADDQKLPRQASFRLRGALCFVVM
jgi:hypothetical protein